MLAEVRAGVEFRVAGRTLAGPALVYGDVSPEHRERFEPGAFGPTPSAPLNIQHDPAMQVLGAGDYALNDSPAALEVRAELPSESAALKLVKRGVKRLSILTPDRRAKLTPLSGTATGPQARPAPGQERFLKRQLSLPVSMISQ